MAVQSRTIKELVEASPADLREEVKGILKELVADSNGVIERHEVADADGFVKRNPATEKLFCIFA